MMMSLLSTIKWKHLYLGLIGAQDGCYKFSKTGWSFPPDIV